MNIWVIFPALAFILGIIASIYLFVEWLRHGKRPWFLLLWSLALFLMYWFQIPVILTNLGRVITVTSFNLFFAITLPITFLALILMYLGVAEITGLQINRNKKTILFLWFMFSLLFFAWQFIVNEGIIKTHALPLVGNIVFYIPLRLLIIVASARWLMKPESQTTFGIIGATAVAGESIIGLIRNVLIIKNVLAYPPEYWYIVLSGLKIFFLLQTLSILLLVAGFFFLHLSYYRTRNRILP